MNENKFDFKFLNKLMYIGAFICIVFALKEFGVLEKIAELLSALSPFFVGVVICWLSKPLANRLRKIGLSKGFSAVISLVIIFGIIGMALSYVIPVIVKEMTQFIKDLPSLYTSATTNINMFIADRFNLDYRISTNIGDLNVLSGFVDNLLSYSLDTAQKVGGFLVSALTAVIISFYMVKDMDKTKNNLIVMLSKNGKDSKRYKMFMEMDDVLNSYVRGLIIDSFIVGLMVVVLCLVLKLKYALIFGILITFLNLIPYIGAVISHIVTTVYAFTVGGPVLALITLLGSFGIQLIDANILQPNIIGKSIKLHPVVVICGLLVFDKLFGMIGMIVALPILAIAKVYIKYKFDLDFEIQEDINNKSKRKLKKEKSND